MANSEFNFNELPTFDELKEKLQITASDDDLEKSANRVSFWSDEQWAETFLESLVEEKMHTVLEFFRKVIYNQAINENDTDTAKTYQAPLLRSEVWAIGMALRMSFLNKDENVSELIKEFRNEPNSISLYLLRMIADLRSDEGMLDSLLTLENNINWDEK